MFITLSQSKLKNRVSSQRKNISADSKNTFFFSILPMGKIGFCHFTPRVKIKRIYGMVKFSE